MISVFIFALIIAVAVRIGEIHFAKHVWTFSADWASRNEIMRPRDFFAVVDRKRVTALYANLKLRAPELMQAKWSECLRLLVLWGPCTSISLAVLYIGLRLIMR